ncbi:type II toxin-antitoxin system MqsA family antitoxin [uncultured Desulfobulbus sp.]|uniref:type II toxin-antitoxin system MqsA family antitoxin n=1 Tax=uncultured Desulfobulbus sp. TaxID=239745 RepID=UPI0029C65E2C|nr:type II toxin-antitoxin system MqsA family antitoxin [uncultured Desulfobulbus sp.]
MKCVICKQGETRPGFTHVMLERGESTIIFKSVPAQICENCGEAYVSEEVTDRILSLAGAACQSGVQTEIRYFAEAV